MEKILITGAAGYQAAFVIRRLKGKFDLTLADRVVPSEEFANLKFYQGDICVFDDVKKACAGQDLVVHLASLVRGRLSRPHDVFADVMVKGAWNVAEACVQCGVKKIVNFSSVCAAWPADTSQPYRVGEPSAFGGGDMFYQMSKYLGEEIMRVYHQGRGLTVINLRPVMITGDGVNPDPVKPPNAPKYWFLHVHPEDVAQAAELAVIDNTIKYGTFQVAGDHPASLFDITETTQKLGFHPIHNWREAK